MIVGLDIGTSKIVAIIADVDCLAFSVIRLDRDPDSPSGAILSVRSDDGVDPVVTQRIGFTDFPLPNSR